MTEATQVVAESCFLVQNGKQRRRRPGRAFITSSSDGRRTLGFQPHSEQRGPHVGWTKLAEAQAVARQGTTVVFTGRRLSTQDQGTVTLDLLRESTAKAFMAVE